MVVKNRKFTNWSEEIQIKLKRLCFRDGYMIDEIENNPNNLDTFVCFENGRPIAWAMRVKRRMRFSDEYHPNTMFYVQWRHRRMGIARMLAGKVIKKYGKMEFMCHDKKSIRFCSYLRDTYGNKIEEI
jgi:hypothetical protein